MKKLYIMMMLVLTGVMAEAQSVWDGGRKLWTNGSGTENDPYRIESADNLAFLSYMVGKGFDTQGLFFKLTTDIDLNGVAWIPIGMKDDGYNEDGCERMAAPLGVSADRLTFRGHFDGGDHTISNLNVDRPEGNAGLFGVVDGTEEMPAVVENVCVVSGTVKGMNAGGIVGKCTNVTVISRCMSGADVEGKTAGGIVGCGVDKIRNCKNTGVIVGQSAAGGIVGDKASEIEECFNNGNVTSSGFGGGILGGGVGVKNILITNCYNTGAVSCDGTAVPTSVPGCPLGGVVGFVWMGTSNVMTNCYNVGSVACEGFEPGGVVGSFRGEITNCYYLNTCGAEGGEGTTMSAEEMHEAAFVTTLNNGTNVWGADETNTNDGYPILLGTNDLEVNEQVLNTLMVYPNPSNGNITVEGKGFIRVYNLTGQELVSSEVNGSMSMELPKGLYLIRLENGSEVKTSKVIVK